MPAQKRHKTDYPGVYFIWGTHIVTGKPEKIFYITYRKDGRLISEKAGKGRESQGMTAARANNLRSDKMRGKAPTNAEQRAIDEAEKRALDSRQTISKLWTAYKENKPNLKGIVTDQNRFDNYIEPSFGSKTPDELAPLDVDRLRLKLLKKRSPATVRNVLELLRRIINFGVRKQLCDPPTFKVELPKVDNLKDDEYLEPSQLKKLMEAIEKDDHALAGPMMKLALFSGMRRGELFRLEWVDLDFRNGIITLRDTKGGQKEKIPMNSAARAVLESIPKPKKKSPYVFFGKSGKQRQDIHKAVRAICDAAGLPKTFRPLHGLRHTYASMLASSGKVDLYTIQKLMTHKSSSMTARYAHLMPGVLQDASDLVGELVTAATATEEKAAKEK